MDYNKTEDALQYIDMCEDYDNSFLMEKVQAYLPKGASLLELGIGPGVDLDVLKEHYKVVGSDFSQAFLDLYQQKHPEVELIRLDAARLDVNRQFDCIYSNKVLHHLSKEGLKASIARQANLLHAGGLVIHTFWKGEKAEEIADLHFQHYEKAILRELWQGWEELELSIYTELHTDDSLLWIGRMK